MRVKRRFEGSCAGEVSRDEELLKSRHSRLVEPSPKEKEVENPERDDPALIHHRIYRDSK